MRRWQFKANPAKDWNDPGPDLLRTKPNARAKIKEDLEAFDGGWYVRTKTGDQKWSAWSGPHKRAEILEAFDGWKPPNKTYAQWTRKQDDGTGFRDAMGALQCRVIDVKAHSNCTDDTDKVIALCEAHNPGAAFGGAFVCKQVSGSSTWSQHAYGKAFDHSAYEKNDADTDWCLRMARENRMRDGEPDILLPVNQVLGSRDGRAGYGSNGDGDWIGDFSWHAGGVDDSHEWHVHLSTGKTQGKGTPSCASKGALPPVEADPHEATDAEAA